MRLGRRQTKRRWMPSSTDEDDDDDDGDDNATDSSDGKGHGGELW